MADEVNLQVHEVRDLTSESLACVVRCIAGPARVGDQVSVVVDALDRPVAEGLTISGIDAYGTIPIAELHPGMTAVVTATGTLDVEAVRAAAAGVAADELFRLGFGLVTPR